jgi:hypothetical protein
MHRSHLPKLRAPHTYLSWPASRATQSNRPLRSAAASVATGAGARAPRFGRAWQHVVRRQYVSLTAALPGTEVFYTVKANPAPEVLRLRIKLGFKLRVASRWMPAPVTLSPHTLPGSAWSAPRKDRKHRRETG